jgi:hypothetical protein
LCVSAATISFYDELRTLSASLGTLFTYIAEGQTSTKSKHISHDPYPLLLCDITAHAQADRQAGTMSHDSHLLLLCDDTAPASASSVACAYRVYRDVAWPCVDRIHHNIYIYIYIYSLPPPCKTVILLAYHSFNGNPVFQSTSLWKTCRSLPCTRHPNHIRTTMPIEPLMMHTVWLS